MKLQNQDNEPLEINLTSLIDVVFLLLIFFMVSTTFERQAAIKIDLPEAATGAASEAPPETIELVIDEQGRMFVSDRALLDSRRTTLRAALQEVAGQERNIPVVLRADSDTPHHFVVTAMDVLGEMGFAALSIATEQADPEE